MNRFSARVAYATLAAIAAPHFGGCPVDEDQSPGECMPSCSQAFLTPGEAYRIAYQNSFGGSQTVVIRADEFGVVAICGCTEITAGPLLLIGPPDCSNAQPQPAILPNNPDTYYGQNIQGVTEPDQGRISFTIDSVMQDEPVFGLFAADRYPDVLIGSSSGSVLAERDPNGNGRVYTIHFTATDDDGETCQGVVKVCAPVEEGGTCIDDGPLYDSAAQPEIDLSVAASAPQSAGVGEEVRYTFSVTNQSSLTARHIEIEVDLFLLADELDVVSFSAGCELTIVDNLRCTIAELAAGASAPFELVYRPLVAGRFVIPARVRTNFGANFSDPDPSNNLATAETQVAVTGGADLALEKSVSATSAAIGDPLTYTLAVTNHGPAAATGVVITDTLRPGAAFVSASSGCVEVNGVVTCSPTTPDARLAVGESVTFAIFVTAASGTTLFNAASVTSAVQDQEPSNNGDSVSTQLSGGSNADLGLSISIAPDPAILNGLHTVTITVTNAGPAAATAVMLTTSLPAASAEVGNIVVSQGTVAGSAGSATASLGTLASGASATMTINVLPFVTGVIGFQASVAATETDPNPANNNTTLNVAVNPPS